MTVWYVVALVVFLVVAVVIVRRKMRGAILERLPILPGESIVLQESDLKVFHKIREASGGQDLTYRVTVALTDRRILVATGGPEGKHKFVLKMILDYTTPAPVVGDTGFKAYQTKFQLENGYPTYYVSPADVRLVEEKEETVVRITVPFPEHGSLYVEPEVVIHTKQAERYRALFPA